MACTESKSFSSSVRRPNFFLVGAPKCGTTALASYLESHPHAAIAHPKEPHFFSPDIWDQGYNTLDRYLECFRHAREDAKAIGDASVFYLYSSVAVGSILRFDPQARFLVMVRNPVEMLQSYHSQLVFNGHETEKSFEQAWRLQKARREGRELPKPCRWPVVLDYRRVGMLGEQVAKLMGEVGAAQVHVIALEDLRTDPRSVFSAVLKFLDLAPVRRVSFDPVNTNKVPRTRALSVLAREIQGLRRRLGVPPLNTGVTRLLCRLNACHMARQPIRAGFARELRETFREDVGVLGRVLGRDLSSWVQDIE